MLGAPAAIADEPTPSESPITVTAAEDLDSWMETLAVPADERAALLLKLENGQPWDSLNPSATFSTEEISLSGLPVEKRTYADGSVSVTGVAASDSSTSIDALIEPSAQGVAVPFASISECAIAGAAGDTIYSNCYVFHGTGIVTLSFRADYITGGGTTPDSVSNPWDEANLLVGYSLAGESLSITRAAETSTLPAEIRYRVQGTLFGPFPTTMEVSLRLQVKDGIAQATV
ncbi:hypothetical protein SAMN05216368_1307 [Cryobacterium flavum]|uniref:Uncharacterized protein n=1 Tax=Cryobacterium flavum TaxID=1424659 RepID=A0A5E9G465_9MICO|nr:hypothetical protein SAMN05216368_1307 [Cryobacterium flavum]